MAIQLEIEENRIRKAQCAGEMFRGFEAILRGRHPADAQVITQRICGVCPISHGIASITAQDQAYGIQPPDNGRLLRNLIQSANYLQSHIVHFYHLSALDYIDVTAVTQYAGKDPLLVEVKGWVENQFRSGVLHPAAPFLPRYEGRYVESAEFNLLGLKHYLDAFDMRSLAHKMAALFAGKIPHAATLVPGGVTEKVTAKAVAAYQSLLQKLQTFIRECYLPDAIELAKAFPDCFELGKGCGNFMSYGVFPESGDGSRTYLPSGTLIDGRFLPLDASQIHEEVRYSYYSSPSQLPPSQGETVACPGKTDAYSWVKAPRYNGKPMEVGPLARARIALAADPAGAFKNRMDSMLAECYQDSGKLDSVMGRHLARAAEALLLADQCRRWTDQLQPDQPTFLDFTIPDAAQGVGLTEAPRGALGHWIDIEKHKIRNYQCVVPTTWNGSPRDDQGVPGPVEQSLEGTTLKDPNHPIEAARIVRSYDPCLACAIH